MKRFAFFPLALLAACSSSDDTTTPPSPVDSATDSVVTDADASPSDTPVADADAGDPKVAACTAWATARCNKSDQCNKMVIVTQSLTVARCIERRKIACLGMAAAPGSGFSAAAVEACAKGIALETCIQASHGPHPKECTQTGSLDEGAPCGFGEQCKSGNCTLAGGADCQKCGKPFLPLGATCSGFECEPGLQCVSSKCVRASDTGGPCSVDQPCWIGARCVGSTCVANVSKGASCDTLACDSNQLLKCDPTTKTCVDVTFAKPGEACGTNPCNGDGTCKMDDAGTTGICIARVADGAACDSSTGSCFPAAACIAGKCTPFDATTCK